MFHCSSKLNRETDVRKCFLYPFSIELLLDGNSEHVENMKENMFETALGLAKCLSHTK